MQRSSSISKISRPRVPEAFPRERLFQRLDQTLKRPITWVAGPGGAGKTTLVASYLDARKLSAVWYLVDRGDADVATLFHYLGVAAKRAGPRARRELPHFSSEYELGVETFSRRWFERFFARLKPPYALVLDDYQEVGAEGRFHEVVAGALSTVPEGGHVVIVSRTSPPPPLMRYRGRGLMEVLSWDDLRLTPQETEGVIRSRASEWKGDLHLLHERAQGWVAGLILMLEMRTGAAAGSDVRGDRTPSEIFDYFAGEAFDSVDAELRRFLLQTSFLPKLLPAVAAQLTTEPRAGEILTELRRRNFFVEKRVTPEVAYRYHPLFREFLQSRAKTDLGAQEQADLARRAGILLQQRGETEDAAELFAAARDWPGLVRLIEAESSTLLAQGRTRTLERWLEALPADVFEANAWLLFWKGACRVGLDIPAARSLFEGALAGFRREGDASGAYLAWAATVDTYAYEMNDWRPLRGWVEVFDELRRLHPEYPSREVETRVAASMFVSLVLGEIDQPRILAWAERVGTLLEGNADLNIRLQTSFYLSIYYLWMGEFRKNALLLDTLRSESGSPNALPVAGIALRMMEAMQHWLNAEHAECRKAVAAGLELAEESGVHVWDNLLRACAAEGAMVCGDDEAVGKILSEMEAAPWKSTIDLIYCYFLDAWRCQVKGDLLTSLDRMETAAGLVDRLGSFYHESIWHTGMAYLLLARGEGRKAPVHLARSREIAGLMKSRFLAYITDLAEAYTLFSTGEDRDALPLLRRAMEAGRDGGYVHFIWWLPAVMADLCARALDHGIEPEYVRDLIRKRALVPPAGFAGESWPWPLRVLTLGRFEVRREGEPLRFSRKAPKKALEMLKTLAAWGRDGVPEEKLWDALWPDAEGDAAHLSFTATLHRLRQAIGLEGAILLREGVVRLNSEIVWVDAWAFEELLKREPGRALGLYAGSFLGSEFPNGWAGPARDRLRTKFVRAAVAAGEGLRRAGDLGRAVSVYERALEAEPLSDELCRHLMSCQRDAGLRADAAEAYRRHVGRLRAEGGGAPSAAIVELYRLLREA